MSLSVEEKVLRLEVPVDDVQTVEVVQAGDDLGGVEESGAGTKPTRVPQITWRVN